MSCHALAFATLVATVWSSVYAADDYAFGPDSQKQDGVPQGRVEETTFESPNVYKGTARKIWVYIPQQYDGSTPAALMVFQDGNTYQRENGQCRAPIVFDNLIAKITLGK